jgi:hypothetical protein
MKLHWENPSLPWVVAVGLVFAKATSFAADTTPVDISKLPPASQKTVDFEKDIKPILAKSCFRCHGGENPKGHFDLTGQETALKGGNRGVDILPRRSDQSPLIHNVSGLVSGMRMPPAKSEALTPDEIGLLRAWIDQGALWGSAAPPGPRVAFSASPQLRWIGVSGNEAKFREHYWVNNGWGGGLKDFELVEKKSARDTVRVEGRILPAEHDYRTSVSYERHDLGYARFGWEQYRKYYDDEGGDFPALNIIPYRLDQELHLDMGKAMFELGLNKPNWPRIKLGYEYQYKEGAKSSLTWGSVGSQPPEFTQADSRNIFPAYKDVDEHAHLIHLDIDHEFPVVRLLNNFQAEFYNQNDALHEVSYFNPDTGNADRLVLVKERYEHFQAANAFRLEKQVSPWLYLSAGYLFAKLDGDSLFNASTLVSPLSMAGYAVDDKFWLSHQILLDQQTHTFNLNTLLGPWDGLNLTAGVQNEWMSQHGFGDVSLNEGDPTDPFYFIEQPAILRSDMDRVTTDEQVGARYTKIPYTVFYAEGRFQQEAMGQSEEMNETPSVLGHDFLQNTDVSGDLEEYRTGFDFSPWRKISLNASFRHRDKQTDYNHLTRLTRSETGIGAYDGYPAFIKSRDIISDEFQTKLAYRPFPWWKATLTYQLAATDYKTDTESVAGDVSPGGGLMAASYNSSIYSINNTFTPWRRLCLSGTFSYRDGRTKTAFNGIAGTVPYEGDVFSVIASATYVLTDKTDLDANYSFSKADYRQNNAASALPLGIDYGWHSMMAGVRHEISKNMTARLQYGFFRYVEPTSGNAADYDAHAIFATLLVRLP